MPWIGERLSAIAIRPPALKVLDTFPSRHLAHVEAPVRRRRASAGTNVR